MAALWGAKCAIRVLWAKLCFRQCGEHLVSDVRGRDGSVSEMIVCTKNERRESANDFPCGTKESDHALVLRERAANEAAGEEADRAGKRPCG